MSKAQVLLLPPNLVGHLRLLLVVVAVALPGALPRHLALRTLALLASLALDALDGHLARRLRQATAFGAFYDVALDIATRGLLWTWGASSPWALTPVLLECLTFVCTHKGGGAAWKTGCFAQAPPWVQAVMRNNFRTPAGALAVGGLFGCPLWTWARRQLAALDLPPAAGGAAGLRCRAGGGGQLQQVLGLPFWLHGLSLGGGSAWLPESLLSSHKGAFRCSDLGQGGNGHQAALEVGLLTLLGWGAWGWLVVPGRLLAAAVECWVVARHVGGILEQDAAAMSSKRQA